MEVYSPCQEAGIYAIYHQSGDHRVGSATNSISSHVLQKKPDSPRDTSFLLEEIVTHRHRYDTVCRGSASEANRGYPLNALISFQWERNLWGAYDESIELREMSKREPVDPIVSYVERDSQNICILTRTR